MKTIAIIGAFLGLTSVLMGASSDHLFSEFITADNAERLDVALRYHQLYAVLIFCLGFYGVNTKLHALLKWAGYAFCAGTLVFCTSLYLSLMPNLYKAVYFTPVGGTILICGWLILISALVRTKISSIPDSL